MLERGRKGAGVFFSLSLEAAGRCSTKGGRGALPRRGQQSPLFALSPSTLSPFFASAPFSSLSLSLSLSLSPRGVASFSRSSRELKERLDQGTDKAHLLSPPSLSRNFKQKQQKQNSSPFLQVPPQAASPTRPPRSSRSTASEATRSGPTAGPRSPRSPTSSRRSPGTMPSRCGAAPTPGTRPTLSWSRAT